MITDLKVGQKIKFLTILAKKVVIKGRGHYLVKCSICKQQKILRSDRIKDFKKFKSCGCLGGVKPKGEAAFNARYGAYKSQSRVRKLSFQLDIKTFRELVTKNCFYCDNPPSNKAGNKRNNGSFICNGIDRINNNRGYIKNNCVTCCYICNKAKMDLSLKEFLTWLSRIIINVEKIKELI